MPSPALRAGGEHLSEMRVLYLVHNEAFHTRIMRSLTNQVT